MSTRIIIINCYADDLANFRLLKNANADVKLLVAIGGWNEGSSIYSQVAASPALRQNFVRNVVNFIIRHNLDGLDFDWEYPALRGGNFNDKVFRENVFSNCKFILIILFSKIL